MSGSDRANALWPELPLEAWQDTYSTLHMWTQIIGKIKLLLAPMMNHWWQVPFYINARGFTTSPMPFRLMYCQIDFDFINHEMRIITDTGNSRSVELKPRSVADFYSATMEALDSLGIEAAIWTTPVEIPDRIPFEQDTTHSAYDPEYAQRHWRILLQADRVFKEFRSRFIGKASPVHFFWGAFDLAVTRFSGRRAPEHPGVPNVGRSVMVEAYSHEVSSCGFWAGGGLGEPAFYAYAYPEDDAFKEYAVKPREAYYSRDFGEFVLPYAAVRTAESPDEKLLAFLQSTYEAAAILGKWDRTSLERNT
jgi:hypothetical protein